MGGVGILVQRHAGGRTVAYQKFTWLQSRAQREDVGPTAAAEDVIQPPAAEVDAAGAEVGDLDPCIVGIGLATPVPIDSVRPG